MNSRKGNRVMIEYAIPDQFTPSITKPEFETHRNVKSLEAANRIISRRHNIRKAVWNNETGYQTELIKK